MLCGTGDLPRREERKAEAGTGDERVPPGAGACTPNVAVLQMPELDSTTAPDRARGVVAGVDAPLAEANAGRRCLLVWRRGGGEIT